MSPQLSASLELWGVKLYCGTRVVLKLVKFGQPGHKDNPSISANRRAGETELSFTFTDDFYCLPREDKM